METILWKNKRIKKNTLPGRENNYMGVQTLLFLD